MFLTLSCLLAIGAATAAPITEHQAREIASRFMANHSPSLNLSSGSPAIALTPVMRRSGFYIFNSAVADKGFVIIASDDRLPAVLGYSDSGSFDAADVPPAMQEWLDGYAAQVEAIAAGAAPEARTVLRYPIAPLLPVHWGQGAPYNVLLPHVDGSSNAHAYVGCVAAAMAQIMGYWKYPPCPTQAIPGYTSDDGTVQVAMPSLEPMDFDWENMHPAYYANDSTSTASMAVSNLMLYSTTSLKSIFDKTQTSASFIDIPDVLMTYFGYKNSARYISRGSYTTQSWEDAIYAELEACRPVAYTGSKLSAGHAFVCDGYDGEGRFHINWGWEGKSNGYFFLNLLNTDAEGIGSAFGNYGYVWGQVAAVGLMPGDVDYDAEAALSFEQSTIHRKTENRSYYGASFTVTVSGQFVNCTHVTSQFQPAWGLYNQNGELVEVLLTLDPTSDLGFRELVKESYRTLSFCSGITSGTYRIVPIYRIYPGEGDYRPCLGSDVNYIEVVINGNSCTIEGHGIWGSTSRYTVNNCTTSGTHNHGKPLTIKLNATNTGTNTCDAIYMYANGAFAAMGVTDFEPGETGDVFYRYTPTSAGTLTLSFSLNRNGTPVLYSKEVTIDTMPRAKLSVSYRILNITDEENHIITADRYSIIADVTNTGTETYDEDFTARLYRVTNSNTNGGAELLSLSQPLYLPPGESKSLQFDFDHDLIDGWKYFCYLCYYSNGSTVAKRTDWYYINLLPMIPKSCYSLTTNVEPDYCGDVQVSGRFFTDGKIWGGETLTITPIPNIGWQCSGVTVTDSVGNPVEVTKTGNEIYTFVMPESDVHVAANFERSTGSLFERIKSLSDINAGDTYVLVSRNYDKVMKHWRDNDTTFQSNDIVEWLDDNKSLVKVNDDACFFTMSQVADTLDVNHSSYKAAYLTTNNGYLSYSGTNMILQSRIVPESRVMMRIGNYYHQILFGPTAIGYDNELDVFNRLRYVDSRYVCLFKLAKAYRVNATYNSSRGTLTFTQGVINSTSQQGETVKFRVKPARGYKIASVRVVTTAGGVDIVYQQEDATGIYYFTMPGETVSIRVTFDVSTEPDFILGDVDRDGDVTISDLTALIDYILGNTVDIDLNAADVNADGIIDIADATGLIDMLLSN